MSDLPDWEGHVLASARLSGWGRYPAAEGLIYRPENQDSLSALTLSPAKRSLIARGAGRSYGDAAFNPAGITVMMEGLNRILAFDEQTGLLRVEAGVSIGDLIEAFLPRGWWVPVVPGTKFITIGGAIAADIHGKNHHQEGSFSKYVKHFKLIDGKGKSLFCSRQDNCDAFWATVGGMGLTGIITEVEMELARVPSGYINSRLLRVGNLEAMLDALEQNYEQHYSVAWIDCLQPGSQLGRGVLHLGNFAQPDELPDKLSHQAFKSPLQRRFRIPVDAPEWLLNKFSVQAFNHLYYNVQSAGSKIRDCDSFFFPLDSILEWNRLYGRSGFIQYQCLLPAETSAKGLKEILRHCARYGRGSFLAVLKQFGPAEAHAEASISFPQRGYTLTLDFAVRPDLLALVSELDRIVLQSGGRIYLAKDSCLSEQTFKQMYPDWLNWKNERDKLDPDHIFRSALSTRLGLTGC